MALNFFRQRDIDEMDAHNIPDEFVNYFNSLSDERKAEIIGSRPDLAEGLGYVGYDSDSDEEKDIEEPDEVEANTELKQSDSVLKQNQKKDEEYDFSMISINPYENIDFDNLNKDSFDYLEAFVLPDSTERCILHRTIFKEFSRSYKSPLGSTYGVTVRFCKDCKRLFIKESNYSRVEDALSKRNIPHKFYEKELATKYLRSLQPTYVLSEDEKVYVPDIWVEENPKCPIHEAPICEIPCEKEYRGRKVSFSGYICDSCNKILVRKAKAVDLVDQCAMKGVPEIEYEYIVKKEPLKKAVKTVELNPDYIVENGKRELYDYDYVAPCYKLTEDDVVIVSDSVYCNIDGHETNEVLILVKVEEKNGLRRAYVLMAGYCSQCQKYYIDEEDYKVLYNFGRPNITILFDFDNDEYQITSGEVFNLERSHLEKLESDITSEIDDIHSKKDYTNPYAVGAYDDGGLAYAKELSKNKYGSRLEDLVGYQDQPYSYRVDITLDSDSETYYIGAADIELEGEKRVISFNDDFGRKLVNYQTNTIDKDGKEYNIKLSRQFNIAHEILYGYVNLRTDETSYEKSSLD